MSIFLARPSLRWSVPVAAAVVLGGGTFALRSASAAGTDALPHKTAEQLLVDVQQAHVDGLSGTVVENADLGLPALPISGGGNGSAKLSSLISGTHTMRVWAAGSEQVRLSLLGTLGESDVIRNGNDVWMWSSADHAATHFTLPQGKAHPGANPPSGALATTPSQVAQHFLSAIKPSTEVTISDTTQVAGRAAYELVLSPRDHRSLIDSVRIAVDGTTHVPLRVQILSTRADKPAFEVGFTSVDFGKPDPAQFQFNPPPGTKVTRQQLPDLGALGAGASGGHTALGASSTEPLRPTVTQPKGAINESMPQIVGSGWTSLVKVPVPDKALAGLGASGNAKHEQGEAMPSASLLRSLPRVSGSWGSGRLLESHVVSALLTDSGTLYVGAVTPQVLYAAAGK